MIQSIEQAVRKSILCILERFERSNGQYDFVDTKFDIVSDRDFDPADEERLSLENSIDATKVIPYTIKDSEGAAFTSATYLTEGDKTELSIHITADDWNAAYAGDYSDTVTFTVSYEDK